MRVLDFHAHPRWSESYPLREVEGAAEFAERYVAFMDDNGVDKSVILPVSPFIKNEYVVDAVERFPDRLIGFASVQPNLGENAIEELEYAVGSLSLKGLKLHPSMQGFSLRDPKVWRCVRRCGGLGVPVVLYCLIGAHAAALSFKSRPAPWLAPAEDYALLPYLCPDTTLIYAHMGGPSGFEEVVQCATFQNIYLETSYSVVEIARKHDLAEHIMLIGSEKFVFGSDTVLGLTPREYFPKNQVEVIRGLELSDEEKADILYNNAKKILKI